MTLAEMIDRINGYRQGMGLSPVLLNTRPSSSGSGSTIEVLGDDDKMVLAKSINGGAINWFLKGMLTAFRDAPAPQVKNFKAELLSYRRAIDLS
jgi:hypothetical protein